MSDLGSDLGSALRIRSHSSSTLSPIPRSKGKIQCGIKEDEGFSSLRSHRTRAGAGSQSPIQPALGCCRRSGSAVRGILCLPRSEAAFVAVQSSHSAERRSDDSRGYVDPQVAPHVMATLRRVFTARAWGDRSIVPLYRNRIEDYTRKNSIYNRRSDSYYTMVERDGAFYQQRYQLGPDARKINSLEERIDYIIGSGDQARSYLHRDAEGRLIELPVTWYSENHGYWAMTPGYDQLRQQDFHGPISDGCFFCHDAYPRTPAHENVRESGEPIFPATIPKKIDCQRCHGPGDAHVKAASNADSTVSQIRNAIVNPARLVATSKLKFASSAIFQPAAARMTM